MIRNLALLTGLSLLALAYTFHTDRGRMPTSAPREETTEKANVQAPAFSFTDIRGKRYSLEGFHGKGIVLNFWASWCAPCVIEFPQMLTLAQENKDTIFLFLSQDDSRADIDRFLKKYGHSLLEKNVIVALDKDKTIAQSYRTYKLPETYLINSVGVIGEKIIGANVDWNSADMQEKIESLSRR